MRCTIAAVMNETVGEHGGYLVRGGKTDDMRSGNLRVGGSSVRHMQLLQNPAFNSASEDLITQNLLRRICRSIIHYRYHETLLRQTWQLF